MLRRVLVALLVLASLGAVAGPATAGDAPQETQEIVVTQELRLTPSQPGEIEVQWTFDIPSAVSKLSPRVPSDARNIRTNGFTAAGGGTYEWDGETDRPTITYTTTVNETREVTGPEGSEGRFVYVDTGEWAITKVESIAYGYSYESGTTILTTQRNVTAGEGVAGKSMAYLGPYDGEVRSAHGQRFRLVVPEAATLAESRDDIFASVTAASDTLRVGDRDPQVLMIAAPDTVPWGVEGLQRGDRDFYVTADERVDTPENTWLHEYVHTRQRFNLTSETRWVTEATAQYYAARLTLRQDRIGFSTFANHLRRGQNSRFEDVVLVDPATWQANGGNYEKGALVTGELDRRIRLATDSSATFQDVFRQFNQRSTPVPQSTFLTWVKQAGTTATRDRARQYTETTATPSMWSASAHADAFGALPATMVFSLPADDAAYRVSGPYRDTTLAQVETLVTGETVTVDATVENVGGKAGPYNLTLLVDGRTTDFETGRLDPGESATVTVSAALSASGRRTLSVGGARKRVDVLRPARLTVSALSIEEDTVQAGDTITVRATVENPASRPGETLLNVTRDGEAVTSERVRLAAGGQRTLRFEVDIPSEGEHRVVVGDRAITFETSSGPLGGAGPGLGVVSVLVALVALLAVALVRR